MDASVMRMRSMNVMLGLGHWVLIHCSLVRKVIVRSMWRCILEEL
uniref:Uncharacterized protein n=1 Tax=Brassica oleracea TaxID=3712 RepID=A0A3P6EAG9_BRAOL|nr:unnamed protein product [Brassica oleracea]